MTIWLITLFLIGFWAWIGKTSGAIRMSISLVGLVLGAALAFPLGGLMNKLAVSAGLTHPLLKWAVPPLVVFVLFLVIFGVVAQMVHRKIEVHFKYKEADDTRMFWERMNNRLGMCVGLVTGAAYAILLGVVIYVAGYWTKQLASPNENPPGMSILNSAFAGLRPSGMEKIAMSLEKMPAAWYDAADVLGLIYANPDTRTRLADYPISLALLEKPEFQQLASNTELVGLVKGQGSIAEILKNPKVQGIITNEAAMKQLDQIDLRDLTNFIVTGKSPKFDDEKILGRWQLYVPSTVTELKKKNPGLTIPQMNFIKRTLREKMSDVILLALADNQVLVKGSAGSLEQVSQILSGRVAAPAPKPGGGPPGAPPGGPPGASPEAAPAAGALSVIVQGTWKKNDGKYQFTFNGTQNEDATLRQGTGNVVVLDTTFFGGALVFVKAD